MVHYGHSNQLRQAKAMGDYLIVGVHTDSKRTFDSHVTNTVAPTPAVHHQESFKVTYYEHYEVHSFILGVYDKIFTCFKVKRLCGTSSVVHL